jgi:hypothetical protein
MHYSDVYTLVKEIKNKVIQTQLNEQLKDLEQRVNTPHFITYLKEHQNEEKDIFLLQKEYDIQQLNKVVNGIDELLNQPNSEHSSAIDSIKLVLNDIKRSAQTQIIFYDSWNIPGHFLQLAKKYASHYLPFNQSNDPFKGSDFPGYCWGHTHNYGKLVSEGRINHLSSASNKDLYDTFRQNWTFIDILFRRIGWYFNVNLEQKIRSAIWNALKDLDDKTTFNFNFLINKEGFHSTSLRMVSGGGIEYYENNYGVVRFETREAAVNFLAGHLLAEASHRGQEISFITVYKLPYSNDPSQNLFHELPLAKIENASDLLGLETHTPALQQTITALEKHILKLTGQGIKGRVKANELKALIKEFKSLSPEEIIKRSDSILQNPQHSIMLNRGTGLYFFKSGFKSHSTTESLLQDIRNAAKGECLGLKIP